VKLQTGLKSHFDFLDAQSKSLLCRLFLWVALSHEVLHVIGAKPYAFKMCSVFFDACKDVFEATQSV
jgi:hypothetical protein